MLAQLTFIRHDSVNVYCSEGSEEQELSIQVSSPEQQGLLRKNSKHERSSFVLKIRVPGVPVIGQEAG